MMRKTLESALAAKFPDLKGRLVDRIDVAEKQGAMTKDMAQWAHRIRRLGNDAAHDDEPFSERDAAELRGFTDLLLRYLFTLPGMLEKAQRQSGHQENQA